MCGAILGVAVVVEDIHHVSSQICRTNSQMISRIVGMSEAKIIRFKLRFAVCSTE